MRLFYVFLLSRALYCNNDFLIQPIEYHPKDFDKHYYYAVKLVKDFDMITASTVPVSLLFQHDRISQDANFDMLALDLEQQLNGKGKVIGRIGSLEGHYLVRISSDEDIELQGGLDMIQKHQKALMNHSAVHWALRQKPRWRHKKRSPMNVTELETTLSALNFLDPSLSKQWHLANRENRMGDINVTGVWAMGVSGKGAIAAIIDDGVDLYHDDLRDNFYLEGSYDFNAKTKIPAPRLMDDFHGTRCAGEVAAANNSACGVGVAYNAKVAGIRILGGPITDVDEALALNYGYQQNQVYSCSWGPPDDGQHVDGPNELVKNAFLNGIRKGRGGLGSIFVFATGNGGDFEDNCNFDGYTNSIYGISVGAIDRNNHHPSYSEQCTAHLTVTYSSIVSAGFNQDAIFTTDVSRNDDSRSVCTNKHGGTSAAAPIAVGIIALVLSVNPSLSWRDMQHIVYRASVPISTDDPSWERAGSGRNYSTKFGYGRFDAYLAVATAFNWTNVRPHVACMSPLISVDSVIPHTSEGLQVTFEVKQSHLNDSYLERLEHVTVSVSIQHPRRGNLRVNLISPNGIVSQLGTKRRFDASPDGFKNWTFSSVKHWEENPIGKWTLQVLDDSDQTLRGNLLAWQLTLWGEASKDYREKLSEDVQSNSVWIAFLLLSFVLMAAGAGVLLYFYGWRRHRHYNQDLDMESISLTELNP